MSSVGMAPLSSMGTSTMGMKSVPSPGSPNQTPSSSVSSVLGSSRRVAIFSRNFWMASAVSASAIGSNSAASGMKSATSGTKPSSTTVSWGCSVSPASSAACWVAKAASSASFSALDFRPRRFGASVTGAASSVAASSAMGCRGSSLNSEGASFAFLRLLLLSRFSPSSPFTVYTLLVSFLAIRVRFRLTGSPEAALSAALSMMA